MSDAIIIGGGPGGSTVASLLAARGRPVVLLERERFPRFHIGESLLGKTLSSLRVTVITVTGPYWYFPRSASNPPSRANF